MNRKQPLTYDEFTTIYSKVPRLCVDLIIESEDGVLLIKRNSHSWIGQWHTPGGTVHYKELLHDAVKRIGQEELGVEVEPQEVIGYLEYPEEEKERGFGYSVSVNFKTKISSGTPQGQGGEEIGYFKQPPAETIIEQKEFLSNYQNSKGTI